MIQDIIDILQVQQFAEYLGPLSPFKGISEPSPFDHGY